MNDEFIYKICLLNQPRSFYNINFNPENIIYYYLFDYSNEA